MESLRNFVLLLSMLVFCTTAFQVNPGFGVVRRAMPLVARSATNVASRTVNEDTGLFVEDGYVSTLRFLVPKDEQVAFEHSWKELAQKLAATPGLRYFHVGKRGADFMGPPLPDDEFNYQSFAVWESKEASEQQLDAVDDFKAMANDKNASPANYDGLFALAVPTSISGVPAKGDGTDNTDVSKRLPREALVASNRFGIKPGFEKDFEELWAKRDTSLADLPGFVNFQLLRREGSSDDDGNTYVSYTTWDSLKAFNNWRESDNFKRSHSSSGGKPKESPYAKMPKVVTFKTFLVVSAEDGM